MRRSRWRARQPGARKSEANHDRLYQISFAHHLYKPQPQRPPVEVRNDILAFEQEADGLLNDLQKGAK